MYKFKNRFQSTLLNKTSSDKYSLGSNLLEQIKQAPHLPGVYRFIGPANQILYIGKAKNLNKRLHNYVNFGGINAIDESRYSEEMDIESNVEMQIMDIDSNALKSNSLQTTSEKENDKAKKNIKMLDRQNIASNRLPLDKQDMVNKAVKVMWYITQTEEQALFLEAELIEKFKPLYNIQYRYGKSYSYINFSKHEFPRIFQQKYWSEDETAKDLKDDALGNAGTVGNIGTAGNVGKAEIVGKDFGGPIGPFEALHGGQSVKQIIENICQIFKIRTCSDNVFKVRKRPCLEYDMNRCSAPCVGYISRQEYAKNMQEMRMLFGINSAAKNNGLKEDSLEKGWSQAMDKAMAEENYELANIYYKKIISVQNLKTLLPADLEIANADFFIVKADVEQCVFVLGVRARRLRYQVCLIVELNEKVENVILRWYVKHKTVGRVYVNQGLEEEFVQMWQNKGVQILLYRFEYENLNKLINSLLAQANSVIKQDLSIKERYIRFAKELGVEKLECVEVYDNSHMGGKWNVGVKIVWCMKKTIGFEYKQYKVWKYPHDTNDDYWMMRDMFSKRFGFDGADKDEKSDNNLRTIRHNSSSNHVDALPDLVIIDGGLGQLSVSSPYIPVKHYALSKHPDGDKLHGFNQQGESYLVPISDDCRLWLMKLRDEAHRFAVSEHTKLKLESVSE